MREGGLMSRNLSGRVSPVMMLSASSYEHTARPKAAGWKARTAFVAVLSLAVPQPGWAGSSPPNPPPPEPSAYVTNTGPLDNVGDGGCSQQYNPTILGLVDQQLIAQATQLAADVGGTTAKITAETATQVAASAKAAAAATKAAVDADMAAGLAEAAVGVVVPLDAGAAAPGLIAAGVGAGINAGADTATATAETATAVASGAKIMALGFDVTKNVAAAVALGFSNDAQDLRNYVQDAHLPNCNSTFNGTITSTVPRGSPG
jgi:hypothetical protein